MPRSSLTPERSAAETEASIRTDTLRRTSIGGTGKLGGGKVAGALKLVAGFGLAVAVVLYVEAFLAVLPNPLWTTLLLLPPLVVLGVALDAARRRRALPARPARPAVRPQPAPRPSPPTRPEGAPAEPVPAAVETARPAPPTPSAKERAIAGAIDCFNASAFPRTVAGIAKSLGPPRVSLLTADGSQDVMVTIAWELSWYQYRANPAAPEPVRLEDRGQELDELADPYHAWNAEVDSDGRLTAGETRFPPRAPFLNA